MKTHETSIPIGMLVVYDKGFKFKYKKYYIRKGINTIGSHPTSHILISDGDRIPDRVANLTVTDQLVTLQPLLPGSVHVLSNLSKKTNLMVEIGPGLSYIVEMQKDFMICGRKALIQISPYEQLIQVKGVVNEQMFNIAKNPTSTGYGRPQQHKKEQPKANLLPSASFEATVPLDQPYQFEATVPLDNYEYEATQKLQEDVYEPTIPYDEVLQVGQNLRKNQFSQPASMKVPNNNDKKQMKGSHWKQKSSQEELMNKVESEIEYQMPETIKQDSMPATIKDDPPMNSSQFPPTIQQTQRYSMRIEEIRKKTSNLTKSEPAYRQVANSKFDKITTKNFHSQDDKKMVVDSFEDLFGGVNNLQQSNKTISLKSNNSHQKNKKQIKPTNSQNGSSGTQKLLSDHQISEHNQIQMKKSKKGLTKIEETQNQQSQKQKPKKYFVIGKIQKVDIEKLKKKGFEIIDEDQAQKSEFDLLLIEGQLKWSKILVLSLIKGREIKPLNWINNLQAKLTGKIQGFLWDHIDKRKGKGKSIFNNTKNYYLQQELQDQFQQILEESGANLVDKLSKPKAKIAIHIILDEKSAEGRQLYNEWKNYKNWSFYKKTMIKESILVGEEILDKYKIDQYSF